MATKKPIWVLFGILVISAWILGSAIQVGAETLMRKTVVDKYLSTLPDGFGGVAPVAGT